MRLAFLHTGRDGDFEALCLGLRGPWIDFCNVSGRIDPWRTSSMVTRISPSTSAPGAANPGQLRGQNPPRRLRREEFLGTAELASAEKLPQRVTEPGAAEMKSRGLASRRGWSSACRGSLLPARGGSKPAHDSNCRASMSYFLRLAGSPPEPRSPLISELSSATSVLGHVGMVLARQLGNAFLMSRRWRRAGHRGWRSNL